MRNNTMNIKNSIFAIPAAPAAIPVKPKRPAIIATTKKINVQRNIVFSFKVLVIIIQYGIETIVPNFLALQDFENQHINF